MLKLIKIFIMKRENENKYNKIVELSTYILYYLVLLNLTLILIFYQKQLDLFLLIDFLMQLNFLTNLNFIMFQSSHKLQESKSKRLYFYKISKFILKYYFQITKLPC